jgi:hypothetical protein
MIEVSCPICQELLVVDMKLSDEHISIGEEIAQIMGIDVKTYTFYGERWCVNGHQIGVSLMVSSVKGE